MSKNLVAQVKERLGEDSIIFYEWAFGDEFTGLTLLKDIPSLWNLRHPNNQISIYGDPPTDVDMMINLWCEAIKQGLINERKAKPRTCPSSIQRNGRFSE